MGLYNDCIVVLYGHYPSVHIIMENQMEKNMEHDMKTVVSARLLFFAVCCQCLELRFAHLFTKKRCVSQTQRCTKPMSPHLYKPHLAFSCMTKRVGGMSLFFI